MPTEPSCWINVAKTLIESGGSTGLREFAGFHRDNIARRVQRDKQLLKVKIETGKMIDLWLNTVFAHGGIEGKNKRSDFEAAVSNFGHGAFEWAFRNAVREIGFEFINLSKLAAEPALESFEKSYSMRPSFQINSAFGTRRREKTKEGHLIIREGSSEYFTEETFEERFSRVLSRFENTSLKFILEQLGRTRTELVHATLRSNSFSDLLSFFEGRLEFADSENAAQSLGLRTLASCGIGQPFQPQPRVTICEDCIVITNALGSQRIEQALNYFRHQLLEK